MKIVKDGNMYCVQGDNFINLQESSDYFFIDEKELKKLKNDLFEIIEQFNSLDMTDTEKMWEYILWRLGTPPEGYRAVGNY